MSATVRIVWRRPGLAGLVKVAGGRLRLLQTGYVRNYALAIALGALALVAFLMTRIGL